MPSVTIVGAGTAAASCALELRAQGYEDPITMIGSEASVPYERPPLSKSFLAGAKSASQLEYVDRAGWNELGVTVLTDTIVRTIDPIVGALDTSRGALQADKIVLATGSRAVSPRMPGAELDGVLLLNTVADAVAVRQRIANARSVVVAGAGYIGCEVAATMAERGLNVHLVCRGPQPFSRLIGSELGALIAGRLEALGITFHRHAEVVEVAGIRAVTGVRLSNGVKLRCDAVVCGIGATPNVGLAREAGLAVSDGIHVDQLLRTANPNVLAIGDVALHPNALLGETVRVSHHTTAQRHGISAARTLLGEGMPFHELPWCWSDQGPNSLHVYGRPTWLSRIVALEEPTESTFLAYYLDARNRIRGVVGWNAGRAVRIAATGLERSELDADALANDAVWDVPAGAAVDEFGLTCK